MEKSEALTIVPTLIPFVLVVFAIVLGVVLINFQFQKRLHQQQLDQEKLKREHQQSLLTTSVEIQEEERKRIAQDLHDELGAVLSITKMQLAHYEKLENKPPQTLRKISNNLDTALKSTRRISHQLMPLQLENLGLKKALRSLINQLENTGEIKATTSINLNENDISWPLQLDLYRICSELLNNTLKYASASELKIEIKQIERWIYCSYLDNGKGILNGEHSAGLGLSSIAKRVALHQGTFDYGNKNQHGFFAEISLSLD